MKVISSEHLNEKTDGGSITKRSVYLIEKPTPYILTASSTGEYFEIKMLRLIVIVSCQVRRKKLI